MFQEPLHLYAAQFISEGVERVVILHASDEKDALYCLREGWKGIRKAQCTRIDDLEIGHMRSVYERKVK